MHAFQQDIAAMGDAVRPLENELLTVIRAWAELPAEIRATILLLVDKSKTKDIG